VKNGQLPWGIQPVRSTHSPHLGDRYRLFPYACYDLSVMLARAFARELGSIGHAAGSTSPSLSTTGLRMGRLSHSAFAEGLNMSLGFDLHISGMNPDKIVWMLHFED